MNRRALRWLLFVGLACASGCSKRAVPAPSGAPSQSVARTPVDRLAPDELAPGAGEVFGLPVPRGMTVQGRFRDSALMQGKVNATALSQYVRSYVEVARVELGTRIVFASARIKNGLPDRRYRIEIFPDGPQTRLVIRDVTPVAPVRVEGLSTDALWRRAGLRRDGTPLDPTKLE